MLHLEELVSVLTAESADVIRKVGAFVLFEEVLLFEKSEDHYKTDNENDDGCKYD